MLNWLRSKFKKKEENNMSRLYIYAPNSEAESARNLKMGTVISWQKHSPQQLDGHVVFRNGYGTLSSNPDGRMKEYKHVINKACEIALNVEKNKAAKVLSKVVPVPKMFDEGETVPEGMIVVLRPVNHSAGKDFEVIEAKSNFSVPIGYYAKQFIRSLFECRVWYIGGKMLMARRVSRNKKRLAEKFKCRSNWPYSFYKNVPDELKKTVEEAVKVIKLDVCAFDIIRRGKKFYVLEGNSSPSWDNPLLIKWARSNLKRLIKKKFPDLKVEY